jgi:leucyl aminopeptidase
MDVRVEVGRLSEAAAGAVVVFLIQGGATLTGEAAALDAAWGGGLSRLITLGDFTGKLNQIDVVYPPGGDADGAPPARAVRVIVAGLGSQHAFTADRARQVAATAARRARDLKAGTVAFELPGVAAGAFAPRLAAQAVVEGALLGTYRFDRLKTRRDDGGEPPGSLDTLTILVPERDHVSDAEAGAARGRVLAESAIFARDMVTQPGNELNPRALANAAQQIADSAGLRCEILEPPQIDELGMGLLLGVARGSDEPCRFIILEHAPSGMEQQPPVVLCGKAITFDSGGISIKPAEGMAQMKDDMAGGAAVIGALRALAILGVPRRTIGLIAAAENMPSGRATRPGDVLRALDGQTVEVISTDAEGRLALGDALAYARRLSPSVLVDIATLTGGIVTALGHSVAGLMGNNADVIARMRAAAERTGEKVWELPLWDDEYRRIIRSDIADMKNSVGRPASAIGGGMFLKQFAKDTPWAHVDIAGVSWADQDTPYRPKGATGFGVRLLAEFVASLVE